MGTIVVAQIGKTKYTETTYKRNQDDAGVKSKYAFEAVLQEALADNPDKVDLIILGTKDSYFGTLYEDYKSSANDEFQLHPELIEEDWNKRCDEMVLTGKFVQGIGDPATGPLVRSQYAADLSVKLTSSFHAHSQIAVTVAIIDQGQSGEELPHNFEVIRTTVEGVMQADRSDDNWDIYFDITNGFRSFPIYIYTLTNYLSRIGQNKTVCHIFYGMFDVARTLGYTPLVDLQVVDELLQMINAINEFQNCGSVKQILEILEMHPDWNIPIGSDDNQKETLSYAFEMFDYGTNSNNLAAIERGINLLTNMGNTISLGEKMNAAENLLLKSISEDFVERFGTEESRSKKPYPYSFLLIQLADWFHKMGREGNAAIVVQETVLTYLMERYSVQMTKYLLAKKDIWKLSSDNSDRPNFQKGCDLKEAKFLFAHELRDEIKSKFSELQTEDKDGEFTEFYKNYKDIRKDIRNVMAHIVLTGGSENDYQKYTDTLEDQIGILLKEINNAEDATDGKEDAGLGNVMIELMIPKTSQELWKKLWNPIKEPEGDDSIQVNYNRLLEQMNRMEKITKSALNEDIGFTTFLAQKGQLDLVFKAMDFWINRDEGQNVNPEDYYKRYFQKNKNNSKTGYERLKNTIQNDYKLFNNILSS